MSERTQKLRNIKYEKGQKWQIKAFFVLMSTLCITRWALPQTPGCSRVEILRRSDATVQSGCFERFKGSQMKNRSYFGGLITMSECVEPPHTPPFKKRVSLERDNKKKTHPHQAIPK